MQDILFPILTGLSLVFAGILIGYYLWFRDRTEQLDLCEQLTADNESLASRLSAKTNGVLELEDQAERVTARNEQLQQLCDDLMASREKADAHSRELETELYDARCKLDQTREQMTAECRLRAKSEESLHLAKQQYLDSVVGLEKEWKHKIADSHSIISRHDSEVSRLASLYEQTAEKLHLSTANVAELKSELNAQREMLDVAKNNAVGLEKEYVSLESSMRSQIEVLNEARGQTAAAHSAKKLAESALEESRDEVTNLQLEIRKLQKLNSVVSSLETQNSSLDDSLSSERERVIVLNNERDSLLARCQELDESIVGVNKRSENQQQTIRELRTKIQDLEANHVGSMQKVEELTSQLRTTAAGSAGYMQTIETLRSELASVDTERNTNWEMLESLRAEFAVIETARFGLEEKNSSLLSQVEFFGGERTELSQTVETLRREISQMETGKVELQETLDKLRSEMESLQSLRDEQKLKIESLLEQIEVAGTGRSELQSTIDSMRSEMEELEGSRRELQRTIEALRTRLRENESGESELRTECVTLTQRIADLEKLRLGDESSLKRVSEENAHLMLKVSDLENNDAADIMAREATSRLNSVVKQRDNAMQQIQLLTAEIAELREQMEELSARQEEVAFPRLHASEDSVSRFTREYGGAARVDDIKGLVFTQAPNTRDDLKRIYGVAQVLEKKLNDCGIYTFKQIVEWNDRAIEEFSELLIFKDRIYRDKWQMQAQRLHEEKYDRKAA